VSVRVAETKAEIDAALALRLRVFAGEQGISAEAEIDGLDAEATHLIALRRSETIGTCRLRFRRGACKLERMAVEEGVRRLGVGRRLIDAAAGIARAEGASEVLLHAQRRAEAFYAACGLEAEGETFLEEGIPHVLMRMPLAAGAQ